jgi:hypothetical protein
MAFRLFAYPIRRAKGKRAAALPNPVPGDSLSRDVARSARLAKHALSGHPETDLIKDTSLTSTLGSVTPSRRGQD